MLLSLVGLLVPSAAVFLLGTSIAGAGFGLAFVGAFRSLTTRAAPAERSGVVSTVYVISYLAFSVPALVAGLTATHGGLRQTAVVYCALVAVLAATALALQRRTVLPAVSLSPAGTDPGSRR